MLHPGSLELSAWRYPRARHQPQRRRGRREEAKGWLSAFLRVLSVSALKKDGVGKEIAVGPPDCFGRFALAMTTLTLNHRPSTIDHCSKLNHVITTCCCLLYTSPSPRDS